jgi:TolB protein
MRSPAWSPDGRHVVIVRGTGGVAGELWEVPVEGGAPRRLITEPASTYADAPMFTPDGRGLVHASNRGGAANIWLLPLNGGAPVRLTTGPGPDESPSIAANGTVAFVNSRWRNTLDVTDIAGAAVQNVLTHSPFLWGPAVSKDSQEIVFSRGEVDGTWHIWSVPVAGGTAKRLTSSEGGEVYPRYAPDGSIWFHTWNSPRRIGRIPPGGGVAMVPFGLGASHAFPDPSPDGTQVAFTVSDSDAERIYLAPAAGGEPRKLTASPGTVARWSPDGARIAFSANRGYSGGIFVIDADGRRERRLTKEGGWPVWWPDGQTIGYIALGAGGDQEIRQVSLDGSTVRTLSGVKFVGTNHPFAVFPDGRRLAITNAVHVSDEIWLLQPAKQ